MPRDVFGSDPDVAGSPDVQPEIVNVKDFGATGDGITDDSDAIQAAIDYVDYWDSTAGTYRTGYAGHRGGQVNFPIGTYRITKSLYTEARVRLIGVQGYSAGGVSTCIKADVAGDYTNGPYTEKFMLKVGRMSAPANNQYWWHSGTLENIKLDCNLAPGLAGFHCWGSGENSLIDRVMVTNSGWTNRTINDIVYTAGSKTITSATGAFTQDDVGGRVTTNDAVGFPTTWATTTIPGDGVFISGGATITSATAGFTAADVGKQVVWGTNVGTDGGFPIYVVSVDSATQITVSEFFRYAGTNQTLYLVQPRGLRIESVTNATTAVLTRPAVTSGTGGNITLRRPRPGVQYHGGGATMFIGSLNCSGNSGPGLEIIQGEGGMIQSLTGDNNGTALLRIRDSSTSGDSADFNVNLKAENNSYGNTDLQVMSDHDPVVLIDGCGMIHLDVKGKANAGLRGSRALVRIERNAGFSAGYPSVTCDVEGANPYNPDFEWIIWDTGASRGIRTPHINDTGRFYKRALWNRDIVTSGNFEDTLNITQDLLVNIRRGNSPTQRLGTENWRHLIYFGSQPNKSQQGTWTAAYDGNAIMTTVGYNSSSTLNDEFWWYIPLSKGTWRVDYNGRTGADGAIVSLDWSQGTGASWTNLGTKDQYAASAGFSTGSFTNITIPSTGRYIFRLKATGRNASNTTGYLIRMSYLEWTRTA